jgi:hypothetical protein
VSHVQQTVRGGEVNDTENDDSPHINGDSYSSDDVNAMIEDLEAAMEAMVVEDKLDETADMEDEDSDAAFNKDCLLDIWSRGWYALDMMKVNEVILDKLANALLARKHPRLVNYGNNPPAKTPHPDSGGTQCKIIKRAFGFCSWTKLVRLVSLLLLFCFG